MPENEYRPYGQEREHVVANPIARGPRRDEFFAPGDDIEFIDLDEDRGQIKPTTWH